MKASGEEYGIFLGSCRHNVKSNKVCTRTSQINTAAWRSRRLMSHRAISFIS